MGCNLVVRVRVSPIEPKREGMVQRVLVDHATKAGVVCFRDGVRDDSVVTVTRLTKSEDAVTVSVSQSSEVGVFISVER